MSDLYERASSNETFTLKNIVRRNLWTMEELCPTKINNMEKRCWKNL